MASPDREGLNSATGVACNRCRKTKLRCSRDRPTCAHCAKSRQQCVYEAKRAKPGVKIGAIESIHQRLERLERKASTSDSSVPTSTADTVLGLLARELPKLLSEDVPAHPSKRRRLSSDFTQDTDQPPLPDHATRQITVDAYFTHIHPWVPMLHQDRFRARLEKDMSPELQLLVHAISLSVSRYLPQADHDWSRAATRRWILATAMETVTLEGLQALILIAFDEINDGNASRAWSLVASLTRTVEFAQLTTEHDSKDPQQPICPPSSHIPPAHDWADLEERRRIFWNVFHLDRLCSITMGWNTSLTSIDVHQRLPCDGTLWRRQHEAVLTPYLGIWDKGTGGIGNKPRSTYRADAQSTIDSELWSPQAQAIASSSPGQASGIDMSKVGSFGFCIEAIESMSRVTTYFLQQRVNTGDLREVDAWLARFKELDLRLVHWKMFLPHKWKPGPALSTTPTTRMDPNLTLAHITHNASTVLLHQVIAYPPRHWPFRKKLPCVWSAETCCAAGKEIATITKKYLDSTPAQLPVASPLLAFCLFLAARMMVVHWKFDERNPLLDDFWALTGALQEMSRRWRNADGEAHDLASQYSQRLDRLYQRCQEEDFRICATAYTQEDDRRPEATLAPLHSPSYPQQPYDLRIASPGNQTFAPAAAFGPTPLQIPPDPQYNPGSGGNLDEYFMDMDRVITFNDGSLFTAEWDNYGW